MPHPWVVRTLYCGGVRVAASRGTAARSRRLDGATVGHLHTTDQHRLGQRVEVTENCRLIVIECPADRLSRFVARPRLGRSPFKSSIVMILTFGVDPS
jgi:hypothetical protein